MCYIRAFRGAVVVLSDREALALGSVNEKIY